MGLLVTDPIDVLLTDGDLDLSSGGLTWSRGLTGVAQAIRVRIQMFKGEWFLNLDEGVPYYEDLLGQRYNEATVRKAFRAAIMATPGVLALDTFTTIFDAATRTVTVSWVATTTFGDTPPDSLELGA